MNVMYITSAQDKQDYESFCKIWSEPINPSNQTFHNKMIRCLAIKNHVDVISIRPFSSELCNVKYLPSSRKECEHITWHYPKIIGSKIKSIRVIKRDIKEMSRDFLHNSLILVDTLNPKLLYFASSLSKKYHIPVLGICTDSPSNISKTSRSYAMLVLSMAKSLDGYITLTPGLNELYNEQHKPSIILEGLVENEKVPATKNVYGKYIFFAGALDEKYGIYNIISFFKKYVKGTFKLVICGHSGDENRLIQEINDDIRIIYLGRVSNEEILKLESNAFVNINPRPYNEDLDRFSIPSKVLEYLNSGVPTISVRHTKLQKSFDADAIWIKSSNSEDYVAAFQKLNTMSDEERISLGEQARKNVQKLYSLNEVSVRLNEFLYLFTRRQ